MYKEVSKWLHTQSMPHSVNYLRLRMESHPDYPSILAVKDTLEDLGIGTNACRGTKEELKKENKPFLAHFNMGGGTLLYFKDVATAVQKVKEFDKYWSGNVIFAEAGKKKVNAEHDSQYKKEKLIKAFGVTAACILGLSFLLLSIIAGSAPALLLILSNSIGLYFSWLIAQKEFGISNSVSEKICSMAKHSRCESVLFSKGAKLFNWLTWSDVGIVYFSGLFVYLLITMLAGRAENELINLQLFYVVSLAGLAFPFYSVYYQWKVVRQWCMLCMGVLAVLFINSIISVFAINMQSLGGMAVYPVAVLSTLFVIMLCSWQLLKALYQKSLSSLTNEIKATRLKRNPEIFNALLEKQEANHINLPEKDEAIQFGNPVAPYQLVIACNPYCGPCAKAHQAIEHLYEKYPEQLFVAVRFALHSNDETNQKVAAAKEILKAAIHKPYEAIKDWYSLFDIEKFKQLHHTNGEMVDGQLEKHINWNKHIEITGTPTFFINGRQLPELYSWADLVETLETNCRQAD